MKSSKLVAIVFSSYDWSGTKISEILFEPITFSLVLQRNLGNIQEFQLSS